MCINFLYKTVKTHHTEAGYYSNLGFYHVKLCVIAHLTLIYER